MSRTQLPVSTLEERFLELLRDAQRGTRYTPLVEAYQGRFTPSASTSRTAKLHLSRLRAAIDAGEVGSIGRYRGFGGLYYGRTDEPEFQAAKARWESDPSTWPRSTVNLGSRFSSSQLRNESVVCPRRGRAFISRILTLGVADFALCDPCKRAHARGVNPELAEQPLLAWQIDPLAHSAEYEDELSGEFFGSPSRIRRIRRGGHYIGLRHTPSRMANGHLWNEYVREARRFRLSYRGG